MALPVTPILILMQIQILVPIFIVFAIHMMVGWSFVQVVDEVGRHITFRYEGVLPLADQELLSLLDILVNKADLIEV